MPASAPSDSGIVPDKKLLSNDSSSSDNKGCSVNLGFLAIKFIIQNRLTKLLKFGKFLWD